jgi:hypothetical protein
VGHIEGMRRVILLVLLGVLSLQTFTAAAQSSGRRRRAVAFPSRVEVPETVVLTASKDNTLFESSNGSTSNGAGVHLFSGTTASGSRRRALLAFNIASQVPADARIRSVVLKLHVSQTISGAEPMELFGVLRDWGESTSNAGDNRDGDGAPARTGDATWIHAFRADRLWSAPGGDFDPVADAAAEVSNGFATWTSTDALVSRVQSWVDDPSSNFGWLIRGNEGSTRSAKRFDSRELSNVTFRPTLTIEFVR